MKSKDFFSLINEFKPSLSLFFTYTVDKEVVDKIVESCSGRIIIIHDINKGITLSDNFKDRIVLVPAIIPNSFNNCFHSKIAILKNETNIKVITGSMNLSRSSFSGKHEFFISKDIDPYSQYYKEIISIVKNIKIPNEFNIGFISEFAVEGARLEKSDIVNDEYSFIDNVVYPIHEVLLNEIENNHSPVIKIATPFLSKSYSDDFISFFPKIKPSKIQLFTRATNKISDQFKNLNIPIEIYRPIIKRSKADFHGKMVMLDYGNYIKLYVGSANFSEQGFFKSLSSGGNQECGIIIRIDEPKEIKSVQDWFNSGWEKPLNIENWNQNVAEGNNEFKDEIYAFAIRENKTVVIMISNPYFFEDELKVRINNKVYSCKKNEYNLFSIALKDIPPQTKTLKILINGIESSVQIFDLDNYNEWIKKNDDSLFTFQQSKIESLIDKELTEAIEKEGIRVGSNRNVIIEPPKLEQFYQNVRREIKYIRRRKYFSKYHLKELEDRLIKQNGGMGIYFIMQLIKTFKYVEIQNNIKLKEFEQLCNTHLDRCLDEIGEDKKSSHNFLNKWVSYE
ncbi:MAG: hypothetical protein H6611_10345 [Ignavibacteriales bacterium]|nr:hypothetical protein [Ignavibacteriales bacterium]MCB9210921.1 hypothetical protein [Ignavibacteriales bacterium]